MIESSSKNESFKHNGEIEVHDSHRIYEQTLEILAGLHYDIVELIKSIPDLQEKQESKKVFFKEEYFLNIKESISKLREIAHEVSESGERNLLFLFGHRIANSLLVVEAHIENIGLKQVKVTEKYNQFFNINISEQVYNYAIKNLPDMLAERIVEKISNITDFDREKAISLWYAHGILRGDDRLMIFFNPDFNRRTDARMMDEMLNEIKKDPRTLVFLKTEIEGLKAQISKQEKSGKYIDF
ncbi:MAG: hypothetical protein HY445_02010 [Candidatus Niyogibacteria bacterium]|nr:hypothetical protein [Candidatus Niyogibacteria bacterium]